MISAFWNGILGGLMLAILVGPVFFALMQTTIEKGFFHGVFLALGIVMSDTLYFFLCYLGISQVVDNPKMEAYLAFGGGIIMVVFGLVYIFKPIASKGVKQRHEEASKTTMAREVVKGFLLNGINPGVLIFWIGIIATISATPSGSTREGMLVFALGILTTVFTTDILKAYLANKLSRLVTPKFMRMMNRMVGSGLFAFGIYLFFRAFEEGIWTL